MFIFAFFIILIIGIPLLIYFYPKIRDSKVVDKLAHDLEKEKEYPDVTADSVIGSIKENRKSLAQMKKEIDGEVKTAKTESKKIDNFLDKEKKK